MEALEVIAKLLEKVSVLVAAVLMLVMLRPAGVWLGETGAKASIRRRIFLVAVLGALAIWGTFLGFSVGTVRFNVRMVGIIVAGYLGGIWVGLIVGLAAGVVYALAATPAVGIYALMASVLVGVLGGMWSRRFGTNIVSVVVGAVVIEAFYHLVVGGMMAVIDYEMATAQASNIILHGAKITANAIGVILFMGVLNLVAELDRARTAVRASHDEVRTARLEALQYQVRPHFLFNLLNTLAYLIRTDPTKARELTLDLSEFLRYTLSKQQDRTSLADELEQIERYVDLERARFGDGLDFVAEVDSDLAHRTVVPPLILQPLVENAIQHASQDGAVTVRVEATAVEDRVEIRVLDNGPGPIEKEDGREGVGLNNVRERLDRFYHGDAELELAHREDEGTVASFSIPMDPRQSGGFAAQARRKIEEVVT